MTNPWIIAAAGLALAVPALGQEIVEVSPARAHELVQASQAYLVDVRSVAEYVLVGHPETAYNIPVTFWDEATGGFVLNPDFLEDLEARFGKRDGLIFICRSGDRSLKAAQMAQAAGYVALYHVTEGFEGDLDDKGYRTVGGWKNRLPYTYKIDPRLDYRRGPHLATHQRKGGGS